MPSLMPHWFNTASPCKADIHYMLPPRVRLPNLERLIAQQNYFLIQDKSLHPKQLKLHPSLTQGQPWLVNALAKEMVTDTNIAITPKSTREKGSPDYL